MPFIISIKQIGKPALDVPTDVGTQLFVLGANGVGKSSLMHDVYRANVDKAVRISAHRQSWFSSNDVTTTAQETRQHEQNARSWDSNANARWNDVQPEQRPKVAIYHLVDSENVRARQIADAADLDDINTIRTLAGKVSPLKIINKLLHLSNLPIIISVKKGEQVVASKSGGPEYSIAELSDGERNALIIAATVLTAAAGTLLLIDEPERHLHRSIISPLLTQLFSLRPDCAFIVSTHEVMLPIDHPSSRVLLIRGCTYAGSTVGGYDVDLLSPDSIIDDDLKKDILGARQKILFTEGTDRSLDKSLYITIFPNISVIPKASCRDVEHAVRGIRDAQELHWIRAFGVIDSDAREEAELAQLKTSGIYAVPAYSVESIYYHPDVQRRVSERLAKSIGGDAARRVLEANSKAVTAISQQAQRLSERIAEKEIRRQFMSKLPNREVFSTVASVNFTIDTASILAMERERLQQLINSNNLAAMINRYPIRETAALAEIAKSLGFQTRLQYEGAVLALLQDDNEALQYVRALFGTLTGDIEAACIVV